MSVYSFPVTSLTSELECIRHLAQSGSWEDRKSIKFLLPYIRNIEVIKPEIKPLCQMLQELATTFPYNPKAIDQLANRIIIYVLRA